MWIGFHKKVVVARGWHRDPFLKIFLFFSDTDIVLDDVMVSLKIAGGLNG